MRRTIQDLVASVDPNVKIEPDVEDVRTHMILLEFMPKWTFSSCYSQLQTSLLIR